MPFCTTSPLFCSKSVEELVLLIKEVLKEIVTDRQINSDSALRLFSTARDMLMVFRLAAIYHKKNVENLPQQAGKFAITIFW